MNTNCHTICLVCIYSSKSRPIMRSLLKWIQRLKDAKRTTRVKVNGRTGSPEVKWVRNTIIIDEIVMNVVFRRQKNEVILRDDTNKRTTNDSIILNILSSLIYSFFHIKYNLNHFCFTFFCFIRFFRSGSFESELFVKPLALILLTFIRSQTNCSRVYIFTNF